MSEDLSLLCVYSRYPVCDLGMKMKPKPYILLKDGKPTKLRCAHKNAAEGKCIRLNKVTDSKWTWEKRDG